MPITATRSALFLALAALLAACGAPPDEGEPCTHRGEVKYCLCDDGRQGQRFCTRPDPPTLWTECACYGR